MLILLFIEDFMYVWLGNRSCSTLLSEILNLVHREKSKARQNYMNKKISNKDCYVLHIWRRPGSNRSPSVC